jgi:hypothetical protein
MSCSANRIRDSKHAYHDKETDTNHGNDTKTLTQKAKLKNFIIDRLIILLLQCPPVRVLVFTVLTSSTLSFFSFALYVLGNVHSPSATIFLIIKQ